MTCEICGSSEHEGKANILCVCDPLYKDADKQWERFKLRAQIASEQLTNIFLACAILKKDVFAVRPDPYLIENAVKVTDDLLAELEKEKV